MYNDKNYILYHTYGKEISKVHQKISFSNDQL